jgi:hypothetical protein
MREEKIKPFAPESGRGTISFEGEGSTAVEVDYYLVVSETLARFESGGSWESLEFSAKGWVTPVRAQDQDTLLQMLNSDDDQILRVKDGRSVAVKVWGTPSLRPKSRFKVESEGDGNLFSRYRSSAGNS